MRLYGIDAPDPGQTCQNRRGATYDCFAQATKELQAVVQDKIVRCTTKESPPKQRRLGVCTVEGRDVAGIMVRAGWALAYTALTPDYYNTQVLAMSHRAGMWGDGWNRPGCGAIDRRHWRPTPPAGLRKSLRASRKTGLRKPAACNPPGRDLHDWGRPGRGPGPQCRAKTRAHPCRRLENT
ncbi:thermonuclease family protein [Nitrospirillum sp. BR 11164]|uniref:thermonuclease family protein n=1 Tax=Nitrospirillum sp. BR 11164 TaxID=3104324 RepID=UPI003A4C6A8F